MAHPAVQEAAVTGYARGPLGRAAGGQRGAAAGSHPSSRPSWPTTWKAGSHLYSQVHFYVRPELHVFDRWA
jgi:hypothetical protein